MLSIILTIIACLCSFEGKVKQVLSMEHDVQKYADSPGLTSDVMECSTPSLPYTEMFVCSFSDNHFIQITYICKNTKPGLDDLASSPDVLTDMHTKFICEGQGAAIKCEKGSISIVRANFGHFNRNTSTVTPSGMTHCGS